MECVVSKMTRLRLLFSIMSHTARRVTGSIPVVGSSKNTTFGSPIKAMAMDSRLFDQKSEETKGVKH